MNQYFSAREGHSGLSMNYAIFVDANLFAQDSLSVRINSHLQTHQLRFVG